ncbi:MAG: cytochrome c, partial [Herbaspirillum sp.]
DHCMDCHQANGSGFSPHYPALANNVAVTLDRPTNAIRMILNGGYPPSTTGNPRPFGMPPFSASLSDTQIAALLNYVRQEWGNQAEPIDVLEVRRNRIAPIE